EQLLEASLLFGRALLRAHHPVDLGIGEQLGLPHDLEALVACEQLDELPRKRTGDDDAEAAGHGASLWCGGFETPLRGSSPTGVRRFRDAAAPLLNHLTPAVSRRRCAAPQ